MYIKVTAVPGAKKEKISQLKENVFEIYVKEPAERNLANARIRTLLAEWYDVGIGKVRIVTGHHSPKKIFDIDLLS